MLRSVLERHDGRLNGYGYTGYEYIATGSICCENGFESE